VYIACVKCAARVGSLRVKFRASFHGDAFATHGDVDVNVVNFLDLFITSLV